MFFCLFFLHVLFFPHEVLDSSCDTDLNIDYLTYFLSVATFVYDRFSGEGYYNDNLTSKPKMWMSLLTLRIGHRDPCLLTYKDSCYIIILYI